MNPLIAYRIRFRTSSGSGGLGRRIRQIATHPATTIDVIIIPAAAIKAVNTIICDCSAFCCIIFLFF